MADEWESGLVEIVPLAGGYPTIQLRGGGLPFKGVEFGGRQRLKTTWYIGNPIGTQLAAGPTATPTTMTGRWMDQHLGTGGARALVLQFEALRDRAIPLEVRWGGRDLPGGEDPALVRRGKIADFRPKYHMTWHVEWTCEFEWSGDAVQTQSPTFSSAFSPQMNDFSALEEALGSTQDQTQSWLEAFFAWQPGLAGAMRSVLDAVSEVQSAIAAALTVVDAANDVISTAASGVGGVRSETATQVCGCCDQVISACQTGRAALSDVVGLWTGISSPLTGQAFVAQGTANRQQAAIAKLAMFPTDDPLARLDGQLAIDDLVLSWDLLALQAALASSALASQQIPDIIAIVRPPAGSDLRDLAVAYYGDADAWDVIADYNDLPDSLVPASPTGPSDDGGPAILIPRMPDQLTRSQQQQQPNNSALQAGATA